MTTSRGGIAKPPEAVPKSYLQRFKEWFNEHITKPGKSMSAKDFSRSVSIGTWGGMLPAPGFTTLMTLCLVQFVVPWQFTTAQKALAVAVNMLISPIKYMALPLFIYAGTFALGGIKCDPVTIFRKFHDPRMTFMTAIVESSSCIVGGILVWAVLAIPMVYIMNNVILFIATRRHPKEKES